MPHEGLDEPGGLQVVTRAPLLVGGKVGGGVGAEGGLGVGLGVGVRGAEVGVPGQATAMSSQQSFTSAQYISQKQGFCPAALRPACPHRVCPVKSKHEPFPVFEVGLCGTVGGEEGATAGVGAQFIISQIGGNVCLIQSK